jgi:zinc transport system substrate-binding protein
MVFHPAWGYFAKQYSLVQVPIEIEGKKPKPITIAGKGK